MKTSSVFTSSGTFERRVKARIEEIVRMEIDENEEVGNIEYDLIIREEGDDIFCTDDDGGDSDSDEGDDINSDVSDEEDNGTDADVSEALYVDGRTMLKTPKTVNIEHVPKGKYWQGGLRENLLLLCKYKKCPTELKLMFNIDGAKPYKSSIELADTMRCGWC